MPVSLPLPPNFSTLNLSTRLGDYAYSSTSTVLSPHPLLAPSLVSPPISSPACHRWAILPSVFVLPSIFTSRTKVYDWCLFSPAKCSSIAHSYTAVGPPGCPPLDPKIFPLSDLHFLPIIFVFQFLQNWRFCSLATPYVPRIPSHLGSLQTFRTPRAPIHFHPCYTTFLRIYSIDITTTTPITIYDMRRPIDKTRGSSWPLDASGTTDIVPDHLQIVPCGRSDWYHPSCGLAVQDAVPRTPTLPCQYSLQDHLVDSAAWPFRLVPPQLRTGTSLIPFLGPCRHVCRPRARLMPHALAHLVQDP
jgi:hypothetical protein